MRFDLHVHSTASDGNLDPADLVSHATALGMTALAITDHDSVAAIPEALAVARDTDLTVIPGVELSASWEELDVHILGYFIDIDDASLLARLTELRQARLARARHMVERLRSAGLKVSIEDVLSLAEGGSVGRSHVARALVEQGHAEDTSDAFRRLIGRGRPHYVPKPVAEPEMVVRTIVEAGGLPVLAHPGITGVDGLIPQLVSVGLRGIEAYHGEHTPEQCGYYASIAAEHGLLVTGGSDFHGEGAPGSGMGEVQMPDSVLHDLFAQAGREL